MPDESALPLSHPIVEPSRPHEVGFVKSLKNYLITVHGLPTLSVHDILKSERGTIALVSGLKEGVANALVLSGDSPLPGEKMVRVAEPLTIQDPTQLHGRVISPLGNPLDGKILSSERTIPVHFNVVARGIEERDNITEQFESGSTFVDTLLPLAKGQRQLIFGEPRSGKTTFLADTLAHQARMGTTCIYGAIGKSETDLREIIEKFEHRKVADRIITLYADIRSGAPLIAITPNVCMALANEMRARGENVVVVLDDLGTHAKYVREMSLLSETLPGREAYPGDIFYQHAHIMEQAGRFNAKGGGGTITLLPVIETELENFENLIPTNLMACTDGHLLFSTQLRGQGFYPAIELNLSVTRVGRKTQGALLKELAEKIHAMLNAYEEVKSYGIFGDELGAQTKHIYQQGETVRALLNQQPADLLTVTQQAFLLSLLFTSVLAKKEPEIILQKRAKIQELIKTPAFTEQANNMKTFADLTAFAETHATLISEIFQEEAPHGTTTKA